jgi:hypothetical protein
MRHVEVNGQPGALFLDSDGRPVLVVSLDIVDGLVQTVRAVSNPNKLRHLDPDGDLRPSETRQSFVGKSYRCGANLVNPSRA